MTLRITPTTSEAERKAIVDAMNRCPHCQRKFSPQGFAAHKRVCEVSHGR